MFMIIRILESRISGRQDRCCNIRQTSCREKVNNGLIHEDVQEDYWNELQILYRSPNIAMVIKFKDQAGRQGARIRESRRHFKILTDKIVSFIIWLGLIVTFPYYQLWNFRISQTLKKIRKHDLILKWTWHWLNLKSYKTTVTITNNFKQQSFIKSKLRL